MRRRTVPVAFVFIFLHALSFGQISTRVLEELSGDLSASPVIAVNPRNPLNIVAASVPGYVHISLDGGSTWSRKDIESSAKTIGDPVLVADNKGTFYFFHLIDPSRAIICRISYDGGQTWDAGNPVGQNDSKDLIKPAASVDSKGNIFLTWTQLDKYKSSDKSCQSTIYVSQSSNGKKWSKPIAISQRPGECIGVGRMTEGSMPAITDDKKVFITWANQNHIYIDRSFDGGYMWLSNDLPIAQLKDTARRETTLHRYNGMPVNNVDRSKTQRNGLLYLTYADKVNDRSTVFFMRSHDAGDHWAIHNKMDNDGEDHEQFLPWITTDRSNGTIYILYFERNNENNADVFLASSTDGGGKFKRTKLTETPFTAAGTFDHYLNISVHKGRIAAIWSANQNGKRCIMTAIANEKDVL